MKIAIGCAKVAYPLKESVRKHVEEMGHEVIDFCPDPEAAMHYAEVAAETAEGMLREKCDRGILLCGTGMGVTLVANMFKGITAAVCESKFAARREMCIRDREKENEETVDPHVGPDDGTCLLRRSCGRGYISRCGCEAGRRTARRLHVPQP